CGDVTLAAGAGSAGAGRRQGGAAGAGDAGAGDAGGATDARGQGGAEAAWTGAAPKPGGEPVGGAPGPTRRPAPLAFGLGEESCDGSKLPSAPVTMTEIMARR